jgi:cytochrome c oxidase cbb3-type subunit III
MPEYYRKMVGSRVLGWKRLALPAAALGLVLAASSGAKAVDLKAAASNFSDSCSDCHGQSGKGNGPKAGELKTKPANYTDCAAMAKFNDDYLFKIIKEGGEKMGKSKDMPDFAKAYDDDEIRGLVAYVRSFCKK